MITEGRYDSTILSNKRCKERGKENVKNRSEDGVQPQMKQKQNQRQKKCTKAIKAVEGFSAENVKRQQDKIKEVRNESRRNRLV